MSKARGRPRPSAGKRSVTKREAATAAKQTKKQIAFGRRQARQNRIIWVSIGLLAVVILAILASGVVREIVARPATAVASVNGKKIRRDDFEALLLLQRYNLHQALGEITASLQQLDPEDETNQQLISIFQSQMSLYESELAALPTTVLEQLIEDQLIAQKARELNLTISAADVDRSIYESQTQGLQQTAPVTGTETIETPTPIPQKELDAALQASLDAVGISNRDYRTIVERQLLRAAVQESLAGQVATTGLVLHVQQIQTDTEEQANEARTRLENGEDFATVARELSTDAQVEETGGDLGWIATGQKTALYGQDWDTFVQGLEVGALGQVESNGTFYVVQLLERDDNGTLPESVLLQRQNSALTDWLAEQMTSPDVTIERSLNTEDVPDDPFATP